MNIVTGYKDHALNKWVVTRNGLEAIDASLYKACAILFRMETEL